MNIFNIRKLNSTILLQVIIAISVILISIQISIAQNNIDNSNFNNNMQNMNNMEEDPNFNNGDLNANLNDNLTTVQDLNNQKLDANTQNNILKNYDLNALSLEEALKLEAQITRAKLQKQLNKELEQSSPKIVEVPKLSAPEPIVVKPIVEEPPAPEIIPTLKSIRGVGDNLKAWIEIDKVVYIVKKGDKIKGWRVLKVTDNYVEISKHKIHKKLAFNYTSDIAPISNSYEKKIPVKGLKNINTNDEI